MHLCKYKSGYQIFYFIFPAALLLLALSGCSSGDFISCMAYDPIPIKVAFEKIEYDSSSHHMEIKGKTFAEYKNNLISPEALAVAFEVKDSVFDEEGYKKIMRFSHKPPVSTFGFNEGEFEIKGEFTEGMILYIHYPGYITTFYDLEDLLRIKKSIKYHYKQDIDKSEKHR